jgi:hypothetical protein
LRSGWWQGDEVGDVIGEVSDEGGPEVNPDPDPFNPASFTYFDFGRKSKKIKRTKMKKKIRIF